MQQPTLLGSSSLVTQPHQPRDGSALQMSYISTWPMSTPGQAEGQKSSPSSELGTHPEGTFF